jgi:MOSC domain-containing protein
MEHVRGVEDGRTSARRESGPGPPRPPNGRLVGSVKELWRYPVKSMRGSQVPELTVTKRGSIGDRAWALRDPRNGRIASAKRFPRLLEFQASYDVEPGSDSPGRVRIEVPDGRIVYAGDPGVSELISEIVGRPLCLVNQAGADEKTSIDRARSSATFRCRG